MIFWFVVKHLNHSVERALCYIETNKHQTWNVLCLVCEHIDGNGLCLTFKFIVQPPEDVRFYEYFRLVLTDCAEFVKGLWHVL